ncbi:L-rhamnose mutarotase [Maribacter sp. 2307UL18-2]|uniref:L-rhamnose mutarotase n=1 Tax=Maribacter sp. 2307UL18-2 TaxID=3386274 RepID=UPI0039BD1ACC
MDTALFRRFTYLIPDDYKHIYELNAQLKSIAVEDHFKKAGIFRLEIYQKEHIYFLLVDTNVSFNSHKLFQLLKASETYGTFPLKMPQHDKALERIYKLDQKDIFTPTEGQLKTSVEPYKRFVFTLSLVPNLIEEYKRIHGIGQAWPEITANMKSVGVKDMEIYLAGTQAFLIMDTNPDFNIEEVGPKWQKLPREEEWQTAVAQFQKTDPDSAIQEKWKDMKNMLSN